MALMEQPYAALRARLDRGEVVVLDGPVGSELVRRGVRWRQHGLRTDADTVLAVHLESLEAGADVLRTNTFQLNRRTYQDVFRDAAHMRHIGAPGLERRVPELIPRAVELAQQARQQSGRPDVPIAGVISPLEHCFRPDLAPKGDASFAEHNEIASLLASAGVDFLLLESMNTLDEARTAVQAARATGLPVWVSFVVDANGNVLSGEPLAAANDFDVDAMLVNCAPPDDVSAALTKLRTLPRGPFGGYAHVGKFDPPSWKFEFVPQFIDTELWPSGRYARIVSLWIEHGARIVGGCCGTNASHVRALKALTAKVSV
jgi:S-methylmethionine-dependent homocysteine/selenocysteine methylase